MPGRPGTREWMKCSYPSPLTRPLSPDSGGEGRGEGELSGRISNQAGIQILISFKYLKSWMPAFAGMTNYDTVSFWKV